MWRCRTRPRDYVRQNVGGWEPVFAGRDFPDAGRFLVRESRVFAHLLAKGTTEHRTGKCARPTTDARPTEN
jgi:hypothetical protein